MTLIELLVVVAIIAMLVALLLPAVQHARELGRVNQCKNNLKQIALGCIRHETEHGWMPVQGSYGSGSHFTGDPDLGFKSNSQVGGWLYNILPYIDQVPLWTMGAGLNTTGKYAAATTRILTPVAFYNCPSRPSAACSPASGYRSANYTATFQRSDYGSSCGGGALDNMGTYNDIGMQLVLITDGLANVFLCGERWLHTSMYNTGRSPPAVYYAGFNDGGWTVGGDWDTVDSISMSPTRDTEVAVFVANNTGFFGGPHATLNMAMCDGAVRAVSFSIPPTIFTQIGDRNDGAGTVQDLEAQ